MRVCPLVDPGRASTPDWSHVVVTVPIMNTIDDETLAAVLATACGRAADEDFQSVVSVASALRDMAEAGDDPLRGLVAALEYHLRLDDDQREPYGPFGPMMEFDGKRYPAPLDRIEDLEPGTLALWERAMRLAPIALVRARFADLLWEARFGDRPVDYARTAIDDCVEAAGGGFGHAVELGDAARRAVELATTINDFARRGSAVEAAVRLVVEAIESEERKPGVALRLLDMFVRDRPDRRPPRLDELIDRATERFGDDPWNLESALEMKVRLAPPDQRAAIWSRAARAFRGLAGHSEGLVRYAHLQHALELAEDHGLGELADEIRLEVEGMAEDELDLKTIATEVTIPREDVDRFIEGFVGDDSADSALSRFGAYLPTGDTDENREFVEQLIQDHPLQFLVTRIHIGPENSLVRSSAGEEAAAEQALIQHEAERASMFSLFAVETLDRIRERYGPVSQDATWFENEFIDAATARRIAKSIELYESGEFDVSASVLAPRLERVVRRLASIVGTPVTRSPDRRGRSGGVKGLGEILILLKGVLPEPTRRFLRVLLVETTGLNLRNRISHGLDAEIGQREAALLVQAACHLRLLESGPSAADSDGACAGRSSRGPEVRRLAPPQ